MRGVYFLSFVCTSLKYAHASAHELGPQDEIQHGHRLDLRARSDALCAQLASPSATAFAQLWPGPA